MIRSNLTSRPAVAIRQFMHPACPSSPSAAPSEIRRVYRPLLPNLRLGIAGIYVNFKSFELFRTR